MSDIKLSDIDLFYTSEEELCICGKVFEITEFRNTVYIFITDYNYSCLVFYKNHKSLSVGDYIKITGNFSYVKSIKEYVFVAENMEKISSFEKTDDFFDKRVELHLHSKFTIIDSIIGIDPLLSLIKAWGHTSVAVTDLNNIQAVPKFSELSEKYGIKPIFGCELGVEIGKNFHHLSILAKNSDGLKNLYRIITESHMNIINGSPVIKFESLLKKRTGLLLGTGCMNSILAKMFLKNKTELENYIGYFDYIELFPLNSITDRRFEEKDIIEYYKLLYALGKKHDKTVIMASNAKYLRPEDRKIYNSLISGTQTKTKRREIPDSMNHLRTTREMKEDALSIFKSYSIAQEIVIKNTQKIAGCIEEIKPFTKKLHVPKIENESSIRDIVYKNARSIYGRNLDTYIMARMEKELALIIKNGYSVIFLLTSKMVEKSNSDGYPVGSRGSAGSSFIAFILGITDVNPLKPHYFCKECSYFELVESGGSGFDLQEKKCPVCGNKLKNDGHDIRFEVFLGYDGTKVADIDLNFSGEYQRKVHRYLIDTFGNSRCFRAGTINTISKRSARNHAEEYSKIKKMNTAEKLWYMKNLEGVKLTTGQHAGGMIIIPEEYEPEDFTPIQYPSNDDTKDIFTTHFDYEALEKDLLKVDALAHDGPTFLKRLRDMTGFDYNKIPMNDKKTLSSFSSTEPLNINLDEINIYTGVLGVPEVWTPFGQKILNEIKPKTFYDLIKMSGLAHGSNIWFNNGKNLVEEGIASKDQIISCRDDILAYLEKSGIESMKAFNIMEKIRKGKGISCEDMKLMKEKGIPEWYINSCAKIGYLFPKSHSVSYMIMTYKVAYYKAHYPLEFYSVYFTIHRGRFHMELILSRLKIINELRYMPESKLYRQYELFNKYSELQTAYEMVKRGYGFLMPDIYKSDPYEFKIEGNKLRIPLIKINDLGPRSVEKIEKQREVKFKSVEDLKRRTGLNKTVVEKLQKDEYLNELPQTNLLRLFQPEDYI